MFNKLFFKILITLIIFFILIGFVGVLIIKYNTPFAANFADNNLRPLIGDNNVIRLESIFYNLSDAAKRATYKDEKINYSNLYNGYGDFSSVKTRLNLNSISSESVWKNVKLKQFPDIGVIATTFVRPDPDRPYAIVNIAQIDMKSIRLGIVAGKKEPAGKIGRPGKGIVPEDIVSSNRLVAAFDGGFQYRDGEYGMIVDNFEYLPLKNDLGTIIGYKNGSLKILNYTGQDLGQDIAFIRQNCPILVQNSILAANNPENKKLWGRTLTSGILTWRTGIGLNKSGDLIFAVGNNLTPETLGKSLIMAGAVDAIQLDINPYWVRFNIFDSLGGGQYHSFPLSKRLTDGSKEYLNGYNKDFFYLYKADK